MVERSHMRVYLIKTCSHSLGESRRVFCGQKGKVSEGQAQ